MFIRPHAQFIINSLDDNPADWTFLYDHTYNEKLGIYLDTSDMVWVDLKTHNGTFNIFEKFAIYRRLGRAEIFASWKKANKKKVGNERS